MTGSTVVINLLREIADQLEQIRRDRPRTVMRTREAAWELGISEPAVRQLIAAGHLRAVRHIGMSRGTWVRLEDLRTYEQSLPALADVEAAA